MIITLCISLFSCGDKVDNAGEVTTEPTAVVTTAEPQIEQKNYPTLTISGKELSEYVIEYATLEEEKIAKDLSKLIKEDFGVDLPLFLSQYNVVRAINAIKITINPSGETGKYYVKNENGIVTITAKSDNGIYNAIEAIKKALFVADDENKCEIAEGYEASGSYPESIYLYVNDAKTDFYVNASSMPLPHMLEVGEEITFTIQVYNGKTAISCPAVKWTLKTDDGVEETGILSMTSGKATLTTSISKPGAISLVVVAVDKNGVEIPNVAHFKGGALADAKNITTAKETPDDFESFWYEQLERLYDVLPTDATVPTADTVYKGDVVTEYGIEYNNYYHIKKLTEADIEPLKANGFTLTTAMLEKANIYEVYLKAPGPTPAAGYLYVPKDAKPSSLSISILYYAYSVSSATIPTGSDIVFRVTHHGYENGKSPDYYNHLKTGICKSYGRANGDVNSGYDNIRDCYILYMFLRDLQALRFVTDSDLNGDIENLSNYWNGKVYISGTSMGGYQTLGVSALTSFVPADEKPINVTRSTAEVPGFCNLAGNAVGGRVGNDYGIYYTDNMDYFDCAILAGYIRNEVLITRCGLGDYTCPPSGIVAMYNNLKCEKSIKFYQNSDHSTPSNARTFSVTGDIK